MAISRCRLRALLHLCVQTVIRAPSPAELNTQADPSYRHRLLNLNFNFNWTNNPPRSKRTARTRLERRLLHTQAHCMLVLVLVLVMVPVSVPVPVPVRVRVPVLALWTRSAQHTRHTRFSSTRSSTAATTRPTHTGNSMLNRTMAMDCPLKQVTATNHRRITSSSMPAALSPPRWNQRSR